MLCGDDGERFGRICREVLALPTAQPGQDGVGIGRYNEKRLHMALKRFVSEDTDCHEIDMGNRYIADVMCGGEIYEIQTGSLFPLTKKLDYYLETTACHVTVVHPVPAKRYIVWIDPATGQAQPRHASPRRPGAAQELPELVYISEQIATGRVGVWFLLVEEEEYRYLDGWSRDRKRGSNRYERLPVALLDEVTLAHPDDFRALIPGGLPQEFTAAEFGRALPGVRGRRLYMALKALTNTGVLEQSGTRERARLWRRI